MERIENSIFPVVPSIFLIFTRYNFGEKEVKLSKEIQRKVWGGQEGGREGERERKREESERERQGQGSERDRERKGRQEEREAGKDRERESARESQRNEAKRVRELLDFCLLKAIYIFCLLPRATDLIRTVHVDYLNYEKQQGELPKKTRLSLLENTWFGAWS